MAEQRQKQANLFQNQNGPTFIQSQHQFPEASMTRTQDITINQHLKVPGYTKFLLRTERSKWQSFLEIPSGGEQVWQNLLPRQTLDVNKF